MFIYWILSLRPKLVNVYCDKPGHVYICTISVSVKYSFPTLIMRVFAQPTWCTFCTSNPWGQSSLLESDPEQAGYWRWAQYRTTGAYWGEDWTAQKTTFKVGLNFGILRNWMRRCRRCRCCRACGDATVMRVMRGKHFRVHIVNSLICINPYFLHVAIQMIIKSLSDNTSDWTIV
jgi:hypothetical protein